MREILNLQFGQCGNNIGTKFWEIISSEHGINSSNGIYEGESDLQLLRANVFFNDGSCGKYVPRSIMVDLDSSTVDHIKNSSIGRLFQPDHFISGRASASNNYAKGFYTDGAELLDQIMELVRIEVESCDMLQGFQIFHSLGGGTGSGLTALVLSKIREEWPDRVISTLSIVPSPKLSENVIEPYNCIMALNSLIGQSDLTHMFDNVSCCRICRNNQSPQPSIYCINQLIAQTVSTFSTCIRFPGQLNCDFRKIAVNLIPYPLLHFLMSSYSPNSKFFELYNDCNVKLLIQQLFVPKNFMLDLWNESYAKHITAGVIIRGRTSTKSVEETINLIQNRHCSHFVDYLPDHVFSSVCDINPFFSETKIAGVAISNNSGLLTTLLRLQISFNDLYNKRAYLHWFINEGLEENELNESYQELIRLIDAYQVMNDITDEDVQNVQDAIRTKPPVPEKMCLDLLKEMVYKDMQQNLCITHPSKFIFPYASIDKHRASLLEYPTIPITHAQIRTHEPSTDNKNLNQTKISAQVEPSISDIKSLDDKNKDIDNDKNKDNDDDFFKQFYKASKTDEFTGNSQRFATY